MSLDKVQRIIRKAASKAVPIMYEECDRLGIKPPKIEWVSDIFIAETKERISGAYQYETQTMFLNTGTIEDMIELGIPEPSIVRAKIFDYFHELKHYIGHKVDKITSQEIKLNREKYEAEAEEYADSLLEKL